MSMSIVIHDRQVNLLRQCTDSSSPTLKVHASCVPGSGGARGEQGVRATLRLGAVGVIPRLTIPVLGVPSTRYSEYLPYLNCHEGRAAHLLDPVNTTLHRYIA